VGGSVERGEEEGVWWWVGRVVTSEVPTTHDARGGDSTDPAHDGPGPAPDGKDEEDEPVGPEVDVVARCAGSWGGLPIAEAEEAVDEGEEGEGKEDGEGGEGEVESEEGWVGKEDFGGEL